MFLVLCQTRWPTPSLAPDITSLPTILPQFVYFLLAARHVHLCFFSRRYSCLSSVTQLALRSQYLSPLSLHIFYDFSTDLVCLFILSKLFILSVSLDMICLPHPHFRAICNVVRREGEGGDGNRGSPANVEAE